MVRCDYRLITHQKRQERIVHFRASYRLATNLLLMIKLIILYLLKRI